MLTVEKGMRLSIGDTVSGVVEEVDQPIGLYPPISPGGCIARMTFPPEPEVAIGLAYHLLSGRIFRLRFDDALEWDAYAHDAKVERPDGIQPLIHFLFSGPPHEVNDG